MQLLWTTVLLTAAECCSSLNRLFVFRLGNNNESSPRAQAISYHTEVYTKSSHSRVGHQRQWQNTYIAAIQKLAKLCNYRGPLDEMLHDRLVCEIPHLEYESSIFLNPS